MRGEAVSKIARAAIGVGNGVNAAQAVVSRVRFVPAGAVGVGSEHRPDGAAEAVKVGLSCNGAPGAIEELACGDVDRAGGIVECGREFTSIRISGLGKTPERIGDAVGGIGVTIGGGLPVLIRD